jgi:signal transduction histidine kinase
LLKQFSDFSATDDLVRGDASVGALITSTCLLLEERCRESKVAVYYDLPPADIVASLDVDRIKQVLINLIINACKAMKDGGVVKVSARSFCIGAEMALPWVEIRVSDNGPGIPPESLERIFKPFCSEGNECTGSNSGLGLPICRRIVEQHGGYIRAESILGQGAVFVIALPCVDPLKGVV